MEEANAKSPRERGCPALATPVNLESPLDGHLDNLFLPSELALLPIDTKSVAVYDGPAKFVSPGGQIEGTATVAFKLSPTVGLTFSFQASDPNSAIGLATGYDGTNGTLLNLSNIGRQLHVSVVGTGRASPSSPACSAYGTVLDDGRDIVRLPPSALTATLCSARFHLLNFRDILGEPLYGRGSDGQVRRWIGRDRANFGPWSLTIDSLPDLHDRREYLNQNHGCVATHVCDLRKQDGSLFTPSEGSNAVGFAYWVLSFANGARCACALVEGYDGGGSIGWRQWCPFITDVGLPGANWFPEMFPSAGLQITERAWALWQDSNKRQWFRQIVAVYIDCNRNRSGPEIEMAKAQMALEVLAWAVLQDERQLCSESALRKLDAAPRLRKLIAACNIPVDVPFGLADLRSAFRSVSSADGPSAVVAIRNLMAHPTQKNLAKLRGYGLMTPFQAWYLSLWYVEMVMLSLFDYKGVYTNRLNLGAMTRAVEKVPWAS